MRRKLSLFLLVFIIGLSCVNAQSIHGKIQELDGKPLPYANILLLSSKDSSLVKGAVSDTLGLYAIDNLHQGDYLLSASSVGYKNGTFIPVKVTGSTDVEMKTLHLEEDARQLKEVVVVEKRPFVEQHIDKMVVNVANSIIASGSTALEVLEKAPGVTVDRQSDQIQLRGKDGVIVQIDGKQTYLSMADLVSLLRGMSSENIDQIELITNPSAKYDAAGNSGIINIRMKKNNSVGTNGSVSLAGGFGEFHRERGSFQINHRSEKFNFFGNYSINRGGNYFELLTTQKNVSEGSAIYSDQETFIQMETTGQNAKAGIDFSPSKNTTIGIVWTGFWNDHDEDGTAKSSFTRDQSAELILDAETDKSIRSNSYNHIGNINFMHSFKGSGGQLSIDLDHGKFGRTFFNNLLTHTIVSENDVPPYTELNNEMPTEISISTVKVDYNRTLGKMKFELGYKFSSVENDNNLILTKGEPGNTETDEALSNHFLYTERVNAGYTSLSGKWGNKTEFQLGLRAEHTHSVGNAITQNEVVERNYLNWFPSVFISNPLNQNNTLIFSYSYRIDRPNYQSLNPSRSYVDPYLYQQGNPFLTPQYTHSLELKHGYKDKLFTSIGASFTDDLIYMVIQPVDSVTTERTPLNIGESRSYNITMSYPIEVMKGWNIQTTLLGFYNYFHYAFQEQYFKVEQFSGRLNASNTFTFGKGWTGELTGWLRTPSVYALTRSPWMGAIDAGVQKSIGNAWKVKVSLQDVFHTNGYWGTIDTPDYYRWFELHFDTRVVMFNVSYNFGNQQVKNARQRKTGSEDEAQRTNTN